jgi:hypothetical protein
MRASSLRAVVVVACAIGCAAPHDSQHGADAASSDSLRGGDAVPTDAFSPGTWKPAAKGLWIWYFAYTGLTAAEAAQRAVDDHVGYVLIKSGQDANFWTTRYTAANLAEFTSRGIHVFAWPYVTPSNISGSVQAIAAAAAVPGTDGVVLDVEIEFEGSYAAEAQSLCEGIRAAVPGVWLGYTSFGWVGYHSTLPFSTFDRYCGDAFFPQVYWSDRGVTWQSGLTQALDMIQSANLQAPVWVIQSNDDTPSNVSPTTSDLNAFFAQAGIYSSLWELPSSSAAPKLTQLDSLDWPNP